MQENHYSLQNREEEIIHGRQTLFELEKQNRIRCRRYRRKRHICIPFYLHDVLSDRVRRHEGRYRRGPDGAEQAV